MNFYALFCGNPNNNSWLFYAVIDRYMRLSANIDPLANIWTSTSFDFFTLNC